MNQASLEVAVALRRDFGSRASTSRIACLRDYQRPEYVGYTDATVRAALRVLSLMGPTVGETTLRNAIGRGIPVARVYRDTMAERNGTASAARNEERARIARNEERLRALREFRAARDGQSTDARAAAIVTAAAAMSPAQEQAAAVATASTLQLDAAEFLQRARCAADIEALREFAISLQDMIDEESPAPAFTRVRNEASEV